MGPACFETTRAWISGCTMTGQSAISQNPTWASGPIVVCNGAEVHVSGGSYLESGQYYGGGYAEVFRRCSTLPGFPNNEIFIDPSNQVIGPIIPNNNFHFDPETGVRYTMASNTLQIDHHAPPSAPVLLLLSPLQATPWTYVIGPVFLDPTNLWSDLAVAPASGPLVRTFAVPPTIPFGSTVGVQAFALSPTGELLASNATMVGIW
jgi:hypothetical protein